MQYVCWLLLIDYAERRTNICVRGQYVCEGNICARQYLCTAISCVQEETGVCLAQLCDCPKMRVSCNITVFLFARDSPHAREDVANLDSISAL